MSRPSLTLPKKGLITPRRFAINRSAFITPTWRFFILIFWPILAILFFLDSRIRDGIQQLKDPTGYQIMRGISYIGAGEILFVVSLLVLIVGLIKRQERTQEAGRYGMYATAFAGLLGQIIKHLLGRPRPRLAAVTTFPVGPTFASGYDSFPSGHATASFALALVLSHYYPRGKFFFYAVAALISFSRVYLGSHYASDVFGGAGIGLLSASLIFQWREAIHFKETQIRQSVRNQLRGGAR